MGINGLLPKLSSITQPINIKEYANKRVGVDAYVWLHKGAYACSRELCQNIPTDKYIKYCMKMVNILVQHNVIPVLVFDGGPLPSKKGKEIERHEKRAEYKKKAVEYLVEGKSSAAYVAFQKAVDITPHMAYSLIKTLRKEGIEYIVAPYEADAQLAYLSKINYVDAVISEDSDLLPYGARRVIYKFDKHGNGQEIRAENLSNAKELNLKNFTRDNFRHMCILTGCDYLSNITGIGIKKAHTFINKFKSPTKIFQAMKNEKSVTIPDTYEVEFMKADLTFLHQWVYDPIQKKSVPLNPLPDDVDQELITSLLGPKLDDEVARNIAEGIIHPSTKKRFEPISILDENNNSNNNNGSSTPDAALYQKNVRRGTPVYAKQMPQQQQQSNKISAYFTPNRIFTSSINNNSNNSNNNNAVLNTSDFFAKRKTKLVGTSWLQQPTSSSGSSSHSTTKHSGNLSLASDKTSNTPTLKSTSTSTPMKFASISDGNQREDPNYVMKIIDVVASDAPSDIDILNEVDIDLNELFNDISNAAKLDNYHNNNNYSDNQEVTTAENNEVEMDILVPDTPSPPPSVKSSFTRSKSSEIRSKYFSGNHDSTGSLDTSTTTTTTTTTTTSTTITTNNTSDMISSSKPTLSRSSTKSGGSFSTSSSSLLPTSSKHQSKSSLLKLSKQKSISMSVVKNLEEEFSNVVSTTSSSSTSTTASSGGSSSDTKDTKRKKRSFNQMSNTPNTTATTTKSTTKSKKKTNQNSALNDTIIDIDDDFEVSGEPSLKRSRSMFSLEQYSYVPGKSFDSSVPSFVSPFTKSGRITLNNPTCSDHFDEIQSDTQDPSNAPSTSSLFIPDVPFNTNALLSTPERTSSPIRIPNSPSTPIQVNDNVDSDDNGDDGDGNGDGDGDGEGDDKKDVAGEPLSSPDPYLDVDSDFEISMNSEKATKRSPKISHADLSDDDDDDDEMELGDDEDSKRSHSKHTLKKNNSSSLVYLSPINGLSPLNFVHDEAEDEDDDDFMGNTTKIKKKNKKKKRIPSSPIRGRSISRSNTPRLRSLSPLDDDHEHHDHLDNIPVLPKSSSFSRLAKFMYIEKNRDDDVDNCKSSNVTSVPTIADIGSYVRSDSQKDTIISDVTEKNEQGYTPTRTDEGVIKDSAPFLSTSMLSSPSSSSGKKTNVIEESPPRISKNTTTDRKESLISPLSSPIRSPDSPPLPPLPSAPSPTPTITPKTSLSSRPKSSFSLSLSKKVVPSSPPFSGDRLPPKETVVVIPDSPPDL
eukprot:TRINITY_DN1790_c1_g3_i2.p1 TRINITY_DN1790_c1_g3~~TRINITY_DN1790_c1_g3_i2.p1  ORF type:complete len:1259 (+),score=389.47 TRINITY_DN1790_c1_g3_i2:36-3812(+)